MRAEKEKATAGTVTPKNTQLTESYRNSVSASNIKLQIGTFLLALQTPLSQEQRKRYWGQFESILRQYLDREVNVGVLYD